MSDYMWAKTEIGGVVSRPVLMSLVEKFDVAPPFSEEAEAASPEASSYLVLKDDEAAWGMFEELETYRVEQNILFDRKSYGKYEHSLEFHRFRPCGTNGGAVLPEVDRAFLCGHDNRPMAAVVDIKKAIAGTQMRQGLAARPVELCGLHVSNPPLSSIAEAAG